MAAVFSSQRDAIDLDTGQLSQAGPSGRFTGPPSSSASVARPPRLRTSLVNQDSLLPSDEQTVSVLVCELPDGQEQNLQEAFSEAHCPNPKDLAARLQEPGGTSIGDSSATGGGVSQGGGPSSSTASAQRDVPAGGGAHLDWSSSGSGTLRGNRKFSSVPSLSRKRAPWQINMNEVELGDLIASGSFGSVHKGRFQGRDVAVKLLHIPESSSEKEKRAILHAFKQEVTVWHALHHPNIVEFLGASMENKQWAIVTEFIGGGSLKSFTAQRHGKRLPMHQAVNMALDVARGMAYLHNKDILHRDLKSANLLIDPSYRVKVADFGLARQEAADPGDMTCETGTIRWMAPEVIDHRPYTRKVDVYSFSIVAWEIFTMKLPFEGFSFVQLAHAVVANNARPPLTAIPKPLADILERCWDPLPERRPDFNTVVKWLEDVLDQGVSDMKEQKASGCGACTIL